MSGKSIFPGKSHARQGDDHTVEEHDNGAPPQARSISATVCRNRIGNIVYNQGAEYFGDGERAVPKLRAEDTLALLLADKSLREIRMTFRHSRTEKAFQLCLHPQEAPNFRHDTPTIKEESLQYKNISVGDEETSGEYGRLIEAPN
jgi:hypothetical protein